MCTSRQLRHQSAQVIASSGIRYGISRQLERQPTQLRSLPSSGYCPAQVTALLRSLPCSGPCPVQVTAQFRSLPSSGHCPTQVAAQFKSLHSSGHCPAQVTAQLRSLPSSGHCPAQLRLIRDIPSAKASVSSGRCPVQVLIRDIPAITAKGPFCTKSDLPFAVWQVVVVEIKVFHRPSEAFLCCGALLRSGFALGWVLWGTLLHGQLRFLNLSVKHGQVRASGRATATTQSNI